MSIGHHVIIEGLSTEEGDNLISYWRQARPAYVNIKGGEQFDLALKFAERTRQLCPDTRVILRQWPDDGLWKLMTPEAYIERRVMPLLSWLRQHQIILMPDNESIEADMRPYAEWMAKVIHMNHALGLQTAYGRTAVGNPREDQYAQMDAMWKASAACNGIYSPNEYFNHPNLSSGGAVARYRLAHARAKQVTGVIPITVIGEFGMAIEYNPHRGFRSLGMSEQAYADLVVNWYKDWYQPYGAHVCVFCAGGRQGSPWRYSFAVGSEFNARLLERVPPRPAPITPESPTRPDPAPIDVNIPEAPIAPHIGPSRREAQVVIFRTSATNAIAIRNAPRHGAAVIGRIYDQALGRVVHPIHLLPEETYPEVAPDGSTHLWLPVEVSGVKGWVFDPELDTEALFSAGAVARAYSLAGTLESTIADLKTALRDIT